MSVYFSIETRNEDIVSYDIKCFATIYGEPGEGHAAQSFSSWDECSSAYLAGLEDGSVSRDCCTTDHNTGRDEGFDLNISNSNAVELFTVLGYISEDEGEAPWVGSETPESLEGRILLARALASDCEVPGYETRNEGQAHLIVPTRPAGYLTSRLEALATLCEAAKALDRMVVWS